MFATGALLFVFAFSTTALATEPVEPSEAQRRYATRAVESIKKGDFSTAASLFEASLGQGPLNVTYLNLGRTYYKMGHCRAAYRAYNAVASAPVVSAPTLKEIEAILDKYRSELDARCNVTVTVICGDPNTQIQFNDEPVESCPSESILTMPGNHRVVGMLDEHRWERALTAEVESIATVEFPRADVVAAVVPTEEEVDTSVEEEGEASPDDATRENPAAADAQTVSDTLGAPEHDDDLESFPVYSGGALAGGIGFLGLAWYIDHTEVAKKYDDMASATNPEDYNRFDRDREEAETAVWLAGGVGAALVIGGTIGLIDHYWFSTDESDPAPRASARETRPHVGEASTQFFWRWSPTTFDAGLRW